MLNALPGICRYGGGIVFSQIAERLYERKKITLLTMRRVFNSISQFMPALILVVLAFSGTDATAYLVLNSLIYVFNSALCCGHFPRQGSEKSWQIQEGKSWLCPGHGRPKARNRKKG